MLSMDQLGVAEDGVERRAQLVAHVGEELRLVPARLRELPALVLDLIRTARVSIAITAWSAKIVDQLDLLFAERLLAVARSTR